MAGISTTTVRNSFSGNGSTATFSFTFFCYGTDDVRVLTRTGDADATDITTTSTITVNSNNIGGSVTVATAPATGTTLIIERNAPYTQTTEYSDLSVLKEKATEKAFNKLATQIQQLADAVGRCLQYRSTSSTTSAALAAPIDGAALIYDGTSGKIKAGPTASQITNAAALATAAENSATAAAESAGAAAESARADNLSGTSTTSNTIGTGLKTFTTQAGKFFSAGTRVLITSDSDASNRSMFGTVTAYSSGSLTVNVAATAGSGTYDDWTIRVSGERGATGAQGPQGTSGAGTGDLLAAQNLNDVANKTTAFSNIKQAASETATGVVELATSAETITGADAERATHPAGVKAAIDAAIATIGGGGVVDVQFFTSSGTWTKPSGCTRALVFVTGGGGAGCGVSTGGSFRNGTNGNASSFGSHCTGNGGNYGAGNYGANGGTAANGSINISGGSSAAAVSYYHVSSGGKPFLAVAGGAGGSSFWGGAGRGGYAGSNIAGGNGVFGGGGGGGANGDNNYNGQVNGGTGGGAGGTAIKYISTGLGSTETVTIGEGGVASTTDAAVQRGGNGGAGCVMVISLT